MNVSVTGATGFVGQNLVPFLNKKDVKTYALGRQDMSGDFIFSKDIQAIVHLAGKAHDLKQTSDSSEYYTVNFELTKKLYDAFLKSDAKKFIFISSVKAAADSVEGILQEDVIPSPITDYGKSKLMAEAYIQAQLLPPGKSFYILRPSMIHGAGNKGNLNLLYQFVKKGIPYPLVAFENRRSFLTVTNLCFVINEIIHQHKIPSGIYNVADDDALSTVEVVGILAKSMGKKPSFLKLPKQIISAIARLGSILKLPLNSERLGKLTENYVVSNQKITSALKVNLPLAARDGLLETARSLQNHR